MSSPPDRPTNNSTLQSPYAKQVSQYPSQCEGFVPLEFSSPKPSPNYKGRGGGGHRNTDGSAVPPFYQNNSNNRNTPYFSSNRGNFKNNNRPRNNFNDNRQFGNRWSEDGGHGGGGGHGNGRGRFRQGGGGGGGGNQNNQNKNFRKSYENSIDQYIHPSMTEDPWKQLMDRHVALNKPSNRTKSESDSIDSTSTHRDEENV